MEAQLQANEERKKNSKDIKMTKSPIQGTLKAPQTHAPKISKQCNPPQEQIKIEDNQSLGGGQ